MAMKFTIRADCWHSAKKILAGEFDAYWQVLGNVLHCESLEGTRASGFLARPSRSMTKLYNFAAITAWRGPCSERLHGGTLSFAPGYSREMRYHLDSESTFEESLFRCLHMVFLRRSSRQPPTLKARPNIAEMLDYTLWEKMKAHFLSLLGKVPESKGKQGSYRRGALVEKDVSEFFPQHESHPQSSN